jgi:LCP family protein required for cell wall assembly
VNEDDLRAAFARHEAEAPDVEDLHATINKEATRRRRRRSTALTAGVAAAVALAVGLPVVLTGHSPSAPITVAASPSVGPAKDLNLLLLGSDHRGRWAANIARSDTIMIAHIPAARDRVYLISIERDVLVAIPGHGKDKINTAFYYGMQNGGGVAGGLALAERTVSQLSGVAFDGGVVVEYPAVRSVTDTLGGVPVCLAGPVPLKLTQDAAPRKVLPAGCQTLGGADAQALLQARYDLPMGGYDRDRNAQRFLLGVVEKAAQLRIPQDAGTILQLSQTDGLTLQLRGITAPDLALQLRDLKPADVVALSLSDAFTGGDGSEAIAVKGSEVIPAKGMALLKALKDGTLPDFVRAHPEMALKH